MLLSAGLVLVPTGLGFTLLSSHDWCLTAPSFSISTFPSFSANTPPTLVRNLNTTKCKSLKKLLQEWLILSILNSPCLPAPVRLYVMVNRIKIIITSSKCFTISKAHVRHVHVLVCMKHSVDTCHMLTHITDALCVYAPTYRC